VPRDLRQLLRTGARGPCRMARTRRQQRLGWVRQAPLPRVLVSYITCRAIALRAPGLSRRSSDRRHSKLSTRRRRKAGRRQVGQNATAVRSNALRHRRNRPAAARAAALHSGTGDPGASIAQVGMSGGFCHIVLRLVETGNWATVQRCTDESPTGSSPPGEHHISTRPYGAQPTAIRAAPTERTEFRGRKFFGEGSGRNGAPTRRALQPRIRA
jgi:hypothetical protein